MRDLRPDLKGGWSRRARAAAVWLASVALALAALAVACSTAAAGVGPFFPQDHVDSPDSAVASSTGVTTVVWSQNTAAGTFVLMGRRVDANGMPLNAPVQLSSSGVDNVEGVAVDSTGNAIVLWDTAGGLMGMRWPTLGPPGPAQALDANSQGARIAVSSNGDAPTATVVWPDLDSSGNYSIHGLQWSLSSDLPGSSQLLSAPNELVSNRPVAVAASDSEATIAWTDASPSYAVAGTARARRWPIGGALGTEVQPSATDDVQSGTLQVGADAGGDSVVAWAGVLSPPNSQTASVLRAAQWPAGMPGSTDTPQVISGATDTAVGSIAVSVATGGAATVAWGATHGCAPSSCPSSDTRTYDLREVSLSSTGPPGTENALSPPSSADVNPPIGSVESVIDGSGVTTIAFATEGPIPELFGVRIAASGSPGTVFQLTKSYTDYSGFTLGVDITGPNPGAVTAVWDHPLPCNSTVRSELWPPGTGAAPDSEQVVSVPQDGLDGAVVASDGAGVADVTDVHCSATTASSVAELRAWPAGGSLGAPTALSSPGAEALNAPLIAVDSAGEGTSVWLQLSAGDELQLMGARISPAGNIDNPVQIASGTDPTSPQLAVTPSGDATIVWQQWNGAHTTIYGARWPAGGSPLTPVAISTNAGPSLDLDDLQPVLGVDPSNDATISWEEGTAFDHDAIDLGYSSADVRVSQWPATGAPSAPAPPVTATSAAIAENASGDAAIVFNEAGSSKEDAVEEDWAAGSPPPTTSTDLGTGFSAEDAFDAAGDLTLVAAGSFEATGQKIGLFVRPAGSASFGSPQVFSAPSAYQESLSVDAAGDAAVADRVPTSDPDNDSAQATVRLADGSVCPVQQLGPLGSEFSSPSVALSSAGNGVAVWESFNGTTDQLQSARFSSGCTAKSMPLPGPGASKPSPPTNLKRPVISGNPQPGNKLSCSTGTWSGAPTRYSYAWKRAGKTISGANSNHYTVQISDEASGPADALTCVVTAYNAAGASAPASSPSVLVAVKGTNTCPRPSGVVHGVKLGPLAIGISQASARKRLRRFRVTGNGFDDFCLYAGWGIRVAYPSGALLGSVAKHNRGRLAGKIVIGLTANPYYALDGIRPGAALSSSVRKRLRLGKVFKIGINDWYVSPIRPDPGVLKVRHGQVQEIGLASGLLTSGRSAENRLLRSFKNS